ERHASDAPRHLRGRARGRAGGCRHPVRELLLAEGPRRELRPANVPTRVRSGAPRLGAGDGSDPSEAALKTVAVVIAVLGGGVALVTALIAYRESARAARHLR